MDPSNPTPAPLSLSRIHRLLRPLRTSLDSFNRSLSKHSNTLPPLPTTQKTTTFYKSSRSSLDTLGDQDWSTSNSSNKRRKLSASSRPQLADQDSSSPFKQSWTRNKRSNLKSTKTYGTKRIQPTPLASSSSSSSFLESHFSVWPPSFEFHEKGIQKSELKDRLKNCFTSSSHQQQHSNSHHDSLINKALHLFQTYSNVLDVVYAGGNGRNGRRVVKSLQEVSARQVGWEIEGKIRDWIEEGSELTMEEMEMKLERELDGIEGEEEEDMISDEGSYLRDEMTRGEQDQACSDIQDEWYEACPVHCFRWILAEHATSILYNGFDQVSSPYALIETVFDLCLSYGATSEASRFEPLLISQAFTSPSTSSSSANSFLPILFRSPSSLSLLSTLESHLLQSTFAEKLFYHSYLTLTPTLLPSNSNESSKKLIEYLSLMLGIGRVMVNHLVSIYRRGSETDEEEEGLEMKAFEKDSREVLERCLKLIGTPLMHQFGWRGRVKKGKGVQRGGSGILRWLCKSMKGGEREGKDLRECVKRLSRLAEDIEELVGSEVLDPDDEAEELPTTTQQLGSMSILLELAHYSNHLSTTITLPSAVRVSISTLTHLISTYLLPLTTPETLFSIFDSIRQRYPEMVEIQRAILQSVEDSARGEGDEELEAEVGRKLKELSTVSQESRIKLSRTATHHKSIPPRPRSSRPPPAEPDSSDSDLIIVSASPSPSVSPRRARRRLPPPTRPKHDSFTSEPDELLLVPPNACREPPNRPNKRILLNPSPSPPASPSPSPSPSVSDHTSTSPSPPPPPLRSNPVLKNKSQSRKRRASSQGLTKPSTAPAFRSHVRHKSYDLSRRTRKGGIDEEEDEEDELMM